MRSSMKLLGCAAALIVGLTGVKVVRYGGVREAWAVVRLDGWHTISYSPDWATCYPASFTQSRFLGVQRGDSEASVRTALGEPFSITWYDDVLKGPWIGFEQAQSRWVVASAGGVSVDPGTSMASLEGRHAGMHEYWSYSRFCGSEQSERIRGLVIRGGRVVKRFASVIYD